MGYCIPRKKILLVGQGLGVDSPPRATVPAFGAPAMPAWQAKLPPPRGTLPAALRRHAGAGEVRQQRGDHLLHAPAAFGAAPARLGKLPPERCIGEHPLDGIRQRDRVPRRHHDSGPVFQELGNPADVRRDDRYAVCHGFDEAGGDAFVKRRQHDHIHRAAADRARPSRHGRACRGTIFGRAGPSRPPVSRAWRVFRRLLRVAGGPWCRDRAAGEPLRSGTYGLFVRANKRRKAAAVDRTRCREIRPAPGCPHTSAT